MYIEESFDTIFNMGYGGGPGGVVRITGRKKSLMDPNFFGLKLL